MGMGTDLLRSLVRQSIEQHAQNQQGRPYDPTELLGHVDRLFQHHEAGTLGSQHVLPASRDPYGDPADQGGRFGNVRPASQDPYGDPADDPRSH